MCPAGCGFWRMDLITSPRVSCDESGTGPHGETRRRLVVHEDLDPNLGLSAISAIHSAALGADLGAIRWHPGRSGSDAVRDVLRLSEGG